MSTLSQNESSVALIRPARKEDINFIFDSWLKSWRKSRYAGVIPNHLYYATYRATIESLVARGAELNVACHAQNEDHILGWSCTEVTSDGFSVLHYCYTKDPFIGLQIDHALLDEMPGQKPGFYTFNYPQVKDALESRFPGTRWQWAPEVARRK